MADVHFTRMLCGRKSFKKASGRLLKDRHKKGGSFLRCAKISHRSFRNFVSSLFSQLLLMLAMHSGKMYMPQSFSLLSIVLSYDMDNVKVFV